jgi:hypothetical protein
MFSHRKEDSQTQNPLTCAEIVVGFVSDHLLLIQDEKFWTTASFHINLKKGVC